MNEGKPGDKFPQQYIDLLKAEARAAKCWRKRAEAAAIRLMRSRVLPAEAGLAAALLLLNRWRFMDRSKCQAELAWATDAFCVKHGLAEPSEPSGSAEPTPSPRASCGCSPPTIPSAAAVPR